jgi:hypothetical protein
LSRGNYGCRSDLYGCRSDLYGCRSDLYGCRSDLYGCRSDLYGCRSLLHGCGDEGLGRGLPGTRLVQCGRFGNRCGDEPISSGADPLAT